MYTRKNILICPLEWGLGHAGRMIPVARKLHAMGNNVFIGSGEDHLEFFRKELPGLTYIHFPGFKIKYSGWLPQYLVIFLRTPFFIFQCIKEHSQIKRLIRIYKINIVISDSRIGLWNKSITTVFVTHMMRVPHPKGLWFLENAGLPMARRITGKFNRCFIPDLPGEINVAGKLSHNIIMPSFVRYIGLLSRFEGTAENINSILKRYYCVVILSGPEPQKTIFREKMEGILKLHGRPSVILEGAPGGEIRRQVRGNIMFISHLPTSEMKKIIMESENIVTRSGYTTLMELISLKRSALIIPTPGQPEQEYLAEYMAEKGWFKTISQNDLSASTDLNEPDINYPEKIMNESDTLLTDSFTELLEDKY